MYDRMIEADGEYSPFVRNEAPRYAPFSEGLTPHPDQLDAEDESWGEAEGEGAHPDCTASGIGIFGADDRLPVANTLAIPYRWVCQLFLRQEDSNGNITNSGATGVLVSPRHVLTVAHAVKGAKAPDGRGQVATYKSAQIRVSPARDGSVRPLGTHNVITMQVSPKWDQKKMPASYDFALLTLDKKIGDDTFSNLGGAKLCYWGALSCKHNTVAYRVPAATLNGATAETAGYPKDKGNGEQMVHVSGRLDGAYDKTRTMFYTGDACQGQSGSPVWVTVKGERLLVGLLVKVTPHRAIVLRLTREVSRQLRAWMGTESEAFVEPKVATPKASQPESEWEQLDQEWNDVEQETESTEEEFVSAPSVTKCRCGGCPAREAAGAMDEWEEPEWEEPASEDEQPLMEGEEEYESFDALSEDESVALDQGEFDQQAEHEEVVTPFHGNAAIPSKDNPSLVLRAASGGEVGVERQSPPAVPTIRRFAALTDMAVAPDPGIYLASGAYNENPTLTTCLTTALRGIRGAGGVQVALVDLTKGLGSPEFAGVRHTQSVGLASIAKLLPMYAAFQLRAQLRRLKAATGAATAADLIREAHTRWRATQSPAAGTAVAPITGHLGQKGELFTWKGQAIDLFSASRVPNLAQVMDDTAVVALRSRPRSMLGTAATCDSAHALRSYEYKGEQTIRELSFVQRMQMMVAISDNVAAMTCIDDLGFAYINSVMVQSGLWHPARGGLWLRGNYRKGTWWRASPLGGGGQGTAGALVAFLTLLARDRLVDAASSAAMRQMLVKNDYPSVLTRSPVGGALSRAGRASTIHSKLGLLSNAVYDAALVQRTEAGKSLHYAVAILNAPTEAIIGAVAVAVDNCIRQNNGIP